MKGGMGALQHLNRALFNELTAINQYFLYARMFGNWSLKKLEDYEKSESIDEMKHADRLIERILQMEDSLNLQDIGKLIIGEDVPEALECDLKLKSSPILTSRPRSRIANLWATTCRANCPGASSSLGKAH